MTDQLSEHAEAQRLAHNAAYDSGPRRHTTTEDPLVRYLVEWRLRKAASRLLTATGCQPNQLTVLVLCAGEGGEGRLLLDLGFQSVTVSDLSEAGTRAARALDPRLDTLVADAENSGLPDGAFDVVVVQDGLHHLSSPVRGFTEMLRISRVGALFLEPHDSWASRHIGQTWERNGNAENYVFRWDRKLVDNVASSFLGRDRFDNLSFSFWHHNVHLERLGRKLGAPQKAIGGIRFAKATADAIGASYANQFCGLIVHRPAKAQRA